LVERWGPACSVLRAARPWVAGRVHEGDVHGFDFGALDGGLDLVSGGPPCQPWSTAGKGLGVADERDVLGATPQFVASSAPRAFVFENVPGLLLGENKPYAEWLIKRLREPGNALQYGVAAGVLNAADFGAPQTRRRAFIIGIRDAPVSDVHALFDRIASRRSFCDPTRVIRPGREPWRTVGDALPGWSTISQGWRRWLDAASPDDTAAEVLLHRREPEAEE
jgi:site-specific DNA-cytosine methylase